MPYANAHAYGHAMRDVGLSFEKMLGVFRESAYSHEGDAEFARGWNGVTPCVHFIGFRGEEYWSAVRLWGRPDFIHEYATWSVLGDCAPGDTVIFGPHAWRIPKKWYKHTRALAAHDMRA